MTVENPVQEETPLSQLAPEWQTLRLRASGRRFFFNVKTRHCQWDPPYFEILDLVAEEADNYSKSEIKAAWYNKKKHMLMQEPTLLREAYETLRHTRSRCEYVYKNVASFSHEARRTAANLLCLLLMGNNCD
jgi:hypothetical protein